MDERSFPSTHTHSITTHTFQGIVSCLPKALPCLILHIHVCKRSQRGMVLFFCISTVPDWPWLVALAWTNHGNYRLTSTRYSRAEWSFRHDGPGWWRRRGLTKEAISKAKKSILHASKHTHTHTHTLTHTTHTIFVFDSIQGDIGSPSVIDKYPLISKLSTQLVHISFGLKSEWHTKSPSSKAIGDVKATQILKKDSHI